MRVRRSSNKARPYIVRLSVFTRIWTSFDEPGAPGEGDAGGDGVEILTEEAGEALHGLRCVLFRLPDLLRQEISALVADRVSEGAGEVAGPGDVLLSPRGADHGFDGAAVPVAEELGRLVPRDDSTADGDVRADR
jgi:hypothetical protein